MCSPVMFYNAEMRLPFHLRSWYPQRKAQQFAMRERNLALRRGTSPRSRNFT
jgi:hypothetical protein